MKKTIRFMDWWMGQTRALSFCSRDTYRLIWDRRMRDAARALTRDIQIHQNRVNLLKEMQFDIRRFATKENKADTQ